MRLGNGNKLFWRDILIIALLAVAAGVASYRASALVPSVLLQTYDVWFESDLDRVYHNMIDRWSNHYRTKVHPLFSLATYLPIYGLRKAVGLDPVTATRLFTAVTAGLWSAAVYVLLRLIGCHRFDAILFALIAACSAGSLFWSVVPETYLLGSLSILVALILTVLAEHRPRSEWRFVVVSAITLSFTVTNWMVGILATFAHYPWRRAVQITVNAFCLVVVLWGVQKYLFPSAQFFLGDREETKYMFDPQAGGLLGVGRSFFAHSMIMPAFRVSDQPGFQYEGAQNVLAWPKLIIQSSSLGTGSSVAWATTVLWFFLLTLGSWSLIAISGFPRFRIVLALTLLGQFVLHTVYSIETFLYALHFVPLLVVLTALTTLTTMRPLALVVAALLLLGAAVNNGLQFREVTHFVDQARADVYAVRDQMAARPADPWPRRQGHVVLATPEASEVEKGYLEPGGSFSPCVGSFGVSFWVTDEQGGLITTSDDLPLTAIRQELIESDAGNLVSIATDTPYYHALWSAPDPDHRTLRLRPQQQLSHEKKVLLVIRSVGPAGGPVRSLHWNGQTLTINDRWTIAFDPAPIAVDLGEEGRPGWRTERSDLTHWGGTSGWGYARIELGKETEWRVEVMRARTTPMAPHP